MIEPPKVGFVKMSCLKTPYEDLFAWKTGRARQRELAILKGKPMNTICHGAPLKVKLEGKLALPRKPSKKMKKAVESLKVRVAREIVIVGFELFHAKEALVAARKAVVNAEGDVNFLWLKAAKLKERWEALKRKKVARTTRRA